MTPLPVVVGFGGVGPAGRSSAHHAYRRTVLDALPSADRQQTMLALAVMMGLVHNTGNQYMDSSGQTVDSADLEARFGEQIRAGTLIRRIDASHFDANRVHGHRQLILAPENGGEVRFAVMNPDQLPDPLPEGWQLTAGGGPVVVTMQAATEFKIDSHRKLAVQAAGQLPTGFDPATRYNSRFHPRGLQLAIVGVSDALRYVGIDWQQIADRVRPDQVGVFAGSSMGQLDEYGDGGLLQARLRGTRPSAKQVPLGMCQMPADFINAYVLGAVGYAGATIGACATFLYNLRNAVEGIQSGRLRVAVVGNSEAPLIPEIIEGYAAMSALATDDNLCKLDGVSVPNYRRASRPFGRNCGFVLGESGQFVVLFDDALAIELGAGIHAAIPEVSINADGLKRSISAPGPGNYLTMAKAIACARAILGEESIRQRSFVAAHGSSTPQNRVTESRILDTLARTFAIENWPVTAVKAFVGHSLAPASADQLINALGVFRYGIIPGIETIDGVADDVYDQRLRIGSRPVDVGVDNLDVCFVNSKGFGGNNASAPVLSPKIVEKMLAHRYGEATYGSYLDRRATVLEHAMEYDAQCLHDNPTAIYRFGETLIDEQAISLTDRELRLPGFAQAIDLDPANPYADMS